MSASPVAYPVQVLREHITALEAAITVCVADPDTRPVHKLRTETRRVEALLSLLDLLPVVSASRKERAALLRNLHKLRKAAGEVRDLDVHHRMLEELVEAEARAAGSKPQDGEPVDCAPEKDREAREHLKLGHAAESLRKAMGHERDKAAAQLLRALKARRNGATRASEQLLQELETAGETSITGPELLRGAEMMLLRDGLLEKAARPLRRRELHRVRKAAKAARYMLEALPDDPEVAAAARQYEALQEAGGQWHDAWQLARASRHQFGKAYRLTRLYREQRNHKLTAYNDALQAQINVMRGQAMRGKPEGEQAVPGTNRPRRSKKRTDA